MTSKWPRGYGDLLRAFAVVPCEKQEQAARLCGFEPKPKETEEAPDVIAQQMKRSFELLLKPGETQCDVVTGRDSDQESDMDETAEGDFSLLMPVDHRVFQPTAALDNHWLFTETPMSETEWRSPEQTTPLPQKIPLMPWTRLWPFLKRSLSRSLPGPRIDISQLVRDSARLSPPRRIPTLPVRHWWCEAWIILDRRFSMTPFREDMDELKRRLEPLRGKTAKPVIVVRDGCPPKRVPPRGVPVLVVGDLGLNDQNEKRVRKWIQYGRRLKRRECSGWVLAPCCRTRWSAAAATVWSMAVWDERTPPPVSSAGQRPLPESWSGKYQDGIAQLITLMVPALRVEARLLRALRHLLSEDMRYVSQEYDLFNRSSIEKNLDAMALPPVQSRENREVFDKLDPALKKAAMAAITSHHVNCAAPIKAQEIVQLKACGAPVSDKQLDDAKAVLHRTTVAINAAKSGKIAPLPGVDSYVHQEVSRFSEEAEQEAVLAWLLWARLENRGNVNRPMEFANVEMSPLIQLLDKLLGEQTSIVLSQVGDELFVGSNGDSDTFTPLKWGRPFCKVKPFGDLLDVSLLSEEGGTNHLEWNVGDSSAVLSLEGRDSLILRSATAEQTWQSVPPPPWADCYAWDQYGLYAEFEINKARFKLRWIPPGSFLMGSPADEPGRMDRESPVHRVVISNGFWLGETPVTQGQYEAVTGENPSDFKKAGPNAPVEQVNWHEALDYCEALRSKLEGLDSNEQFRLPSEAEWEYACRAGTEGPLYSGKPLTNETRRCLNLDELAWYGSNSGSTTHPVKGKAINPFGLYDILGNVWEWCEDAWHDDYSGAPNDGKVWGKATEEAQDRVGRGGGWDYDAVWCRAAYRGRYVPGIRWRARGFRLVLAKSSSREGMDVPCRTEQWPGPRLRGKSAKGGPVLVAAVAPPVERSGPPAFFKHPQGET